MAFDCDGCGQFPPCSASEIRIVKPPTESLTIPSVGGLTMRISEWLPRFYERLEDFDETEFVEENVIMEHAIEQLQTVGCPGQKRSSARLRPMPGSPQLVVVDDDVYEELTSREKRSAGGVDNGIVLKSTSGEAQLSGSKTVNDESTRWTQLAELGEPSPPSALKARSRSHSVGDHGHRATAGSRLSSRLSSRSLRSVMSTPTATLTVTDSRPWNSNKNYPWVENSPLFSDDTFAAPPSSSRGAIIRPGPSGLRFPVSDSYEVESSSPTTTSFPTATGSISGEGNRLSRSRRLSAFSSVRGQSNNFTSLDFDAKTESIPLPHLRPRTQPHEAGERYPTSSLASPHFLSPDDMGSTYSKITSGSEESPKDSNLGRIKKLFRLQNNTAPPAPPAAPASLVTDEPDRLWANPVRHPGAWINGRDEISTADQTITEARPGQWKVGYDVTGLPANKTSGDAFAEGRGMSRRVYLRRRFGNALRKLWYRGIARGGQLLQSFSRRK